MKKGPLAFAHRLLALIFMVRASGVAIVHLMMGDRYYTTPAWLIA